MTRKENYEIARSLIEFAMDDFASDPKGYVESMGWEWKPAYGQITRELDFTKKDVLDLAELIAKKEFLDDDIYDDSDVQDYVTNFVAERILEESKKKEGE